MWSDIYHFLYKGGILMIPILAGSIVALAFFLERLWSLRRRNVIPQGLVERVKALIRQQQTGSALVLCQENDSTIARIMEAGLERQKKDREQVREAIQERGRIQSARLNRFVEVLGVTAAIEPLLGLLGTVKGMIEVFHNVSQKAREMGVDVGMLATGIWEALITTAFGLSIAIPVFVGYKYLISKTDRLVLEMEERSMEVVELLTAPVNPYLRESPTEAVSSSTTPSSARKPEESKGQTKQEGGQGEADEGESDKGDGGSDKGDGGSR